MCPALVSPIQTDYLLNKRRDQLHDESNSNLSPAPLNLIQALEKAFSPAAALIQKDFRSVHEMQS